MDGVNANLMYYDSPNFTYLQKKIKTSYNMLLQGMDHILVGPKPVISYEEDS